MNVSIYKHDEVVLCPYTAKPFRVPEEHILSFELACMNGIGEGMRGAFKQHMEHFGKDFHVSGETRRGVYSDHKRVKKISFLPGEFPLRPGDVIKRWATEENFKVLSAKSEAVAGVIINFHAVLTPA